MSRWVVAALLLVSTSCVESNAVVCDDTGWTCPEGTTCDVEHHLCVLPNDPCPSMPDGTECGTDPLSGASRYCSDGICVVGLCGDTILAGNEQCDDGNVLDGDGCSGTCKLEGCGDGIVDPVQRDAMGNLFANEQCDDGGFLDNDGCSSTCKLEAPRWTEHVITLAARGWPSIAYDSHRDRIVTFGGMFLSPPTGQQKLSTDTLEWTGRDWEVFDAASPPGRFAAGMAYDSDRRVVVLFGGEVLNSPQTPYLGDMWTWDGNTWSPVILPSGATAPRARSRAAMAYDPGRHVLVLYGGRQFNGTVEILSDTWEFDGTSWTQVAVSSPPGPREHAGIAYDPKLGGIVIVGGDTYSANNADTWIYRNGTWEQLATSLPTGALNGIGVTYDVTGQRLLAFGGNTTPANSSIATGQTTTLEWNGSAWVFAGALAPSAGRANVGVSANRHQVIAVGGRTSGAAGPTETLILTPTSGWTSPVSLGSRFGMVSANLPERATAIIFGGLTAGGIANTTTDTFELTKDGFFYRGPSGPSAGAFPALAHDPANHNLVLFGGARSDGTYSSQTWLWDNGWTNPTTSMTPAARYTASLAHDGQRPTLVGGGYYSGANLVATLDSWSWTGTDWARISDLPSVRTDSAAAYDRTTNEAVYAGGQAGPGQFLDTTLTVKSGVFGQEATLPLRDRQSALVWNPARQRLTLMGGYVDSSMTSYELVHDANGSRWEQVIVSGRPGARYSMAAVAAVDGSGLLVMSGSSNGTLPADSWDLSWRGPGAHEICGPTDGDADGLVGCDDPDCWWICTPMCPPGSDASCATTQSGPKCGDAICNSTRESCFTCPGDCGVCNLCGDGVCDAGETCPGDCP